jgi:hypothetical protein
MNPSFEVAAQYFYALTADLPPQVTPDTRLRMVTLQDERDIRDRLQTAIDQGVIYAPGQGSPPLTPAQAARRLRALGSITGMQEALVPTPPPSDVFTLVQDWLAFTSSPVKDDPADDILQFWHGLSAADQRGHLQLLMAVIAQQPDPRPLIDGIDGTTVTVKLAGVSTSVTLKLTTVADLVAITGSATQVEALREVFRATPGLLPAFTLPGSVAQRIEAFIRRLAKYFTVDGAGSTLEPAPGSAPPGFGQIAGDPLPQFFASAPGFVLGAPIDATVTANIRAAAATVFPGDPRGRQWLTNAVIALSDLFAVTAIAGATDALRFSLMEALYARGFTSKGAITSLTLTDFTDALAGTVAHEHAAAILAIAGTPSPGTGETSGPRAVNPDGSLVNCIPPDHLSPLGPTAYLRELLRLSRGSTCDQPVELEAQTLSELVGERRGPLGTLHVTRANLETPLPVIDLVNECLEALVANGPPPVIYDTAGTTLAGHALNNPDATTDPTSAHDPATLFAALPEHSSPATPVGLPAAYDKLRVDLSGPLLPYSQPLDIDRSYLRQVQTTRFAVMRRFRREITEFVLDPNAQPPGFRSHQWRFPVRFEIAREYLGIDPDEDAIFHVDLSAANVRALYGFSATDQTWPFAALQLSTLLERTGLTYCQLVDLIASGWVDLHFTAGEGERAEPPACEPCCPDDFFLGIDGSQDGVEGALKRLIVFIRLWRKLQALPGARYTFTELADIATVLKLFIGGAINLEFVRQLAAFQLLRDELLLPLVDRTDPPPAGATGAARTHLLALWVMPVGGKFEWAFDQILQHIRHHAQTHFKCVERPPEFLKLLSDNRDPLSLLAGFDPGDATGDKTWHGHPTHTLRLAEILSKIFASTFGVGELSFLFTVDDHVDGDDPFPLPAENEALDEPLELPDDETAFSLWQLRRKLLDVTVPIEQIGFWSWARIDASLRTEFGFVAGGVDPDPLLAFAQHFFPTILKHHHVHVDPLKRQYRVDLAGSNAAMWNTPPDGPFHYDTSTSPEQLWTELPLTDEAVLHKLSRIRQLNAAEQKAVQDLYFFPRAELARFAFLFPSFAEADERLIQEPDEMKRWVYFQRAFAFAHARSRIIAEHLAGHVSAATGTTSDEGTDVAFTLLRSLLADENRALSSWEADSGVPPAVTYGPQPNGGAFAAILGLLGSGLLGELRAREAGDPVFRELRGPMDAFGPVRNDWNAPIPTVLPAMNLTLTAEQMRFVGIRNGFALQGDNAERLNGADGFSATWTGVLMIDAAGSYTFLGGAPTADGTPPGPDPDGSQRWRVTLAQGQRSWVVLSHHWTGKDWQPARTTPLPLRRGAYDLTVEFVHCPPVFDRKDVKPAHTGFQLKYSGPDTDGKLVAIPHERLFIAFKDLPLDHGLNLADPGKAQEFLHRLYVSTLRDVRRTYQRAFKAVLFARRLRLSVKPESDDGQSELGFLLAHAESFAGQSFFPPSVFGQHLARLDFNFLPVSDNYHSPNPAVDQRVQPVVRRRQALFDWWERLFDYTQLRDAVAEAPEAPAWLLFHEAAEMHPDNPAHLLRHVGIDLSHAALVLSYFQSQATPQFQITSSQLLNEQWPVRIWRADRLLRAIFAHFDSADVQKAIPYLWAADDPGAATTPGNANLTRFLQDGYLENGDPRRYEDLKRLNDGLRVRARTALVAYLTASSASPVRAHLPSGQPARTGRDLSEILLLDVDAGLCQRASRIEDAITAVQTFVQRARLGLEPGWAQPSPDFMLLWDRRFADLRTWQGCTRNDIYRENWIEWDELRSARGSESFRFLEDQLRRVSLTVAAPAGQTAFGGPRAPAHPGIQVIQVREPSVLRPLLPQPDSPDVTREGFTLLGIPDRHARPSWLATAPIGITTARLPSWIEAAIRLGARFVRVAAAGLPMGAAIHEGPALTDPHGCCIECGVAHPPGVDEYYFWLQDIRHFKSQIQDADVQVPGVDNSVQGAWHTQDATTDAVPRLLIWNDEPMVHLLWARVHNGELKQMRCSREGLPIVPGSSALPDLTLVGRVGDTLRFTVSGGAIPSGYPGSPSAPPPASTTAPPPGFRYDLPTDTAEVLPLLPEPPPDPTFPGFGSAILPAYPYFVYFTPGAPLVPLSFFTQAVAVSGVLRSHCRFEAALKWYEAFFNPLADDASWCRSPTPDTPTGITGRVSRAVQPRASESQDGPCCTGGAVAPDVARDRAITLSYLETLLDWGEALVRRNAPESFQHARLVFDTAAKILGARPRTVLAGVPENSGAVTVDSFDSIVAAPPLNPRLLALYERIDDRLALIHACVNGRRLVNGRPGRDMPYFGDVTVLNGWQRTTQPCADEADWCAAHCAYRFQYLIGKALELANEVRSLGAELLAAFEKGDAEYLAALRTSQERQMAELGLVVRQNQWREADWQVQALGKTKEISQTRRRYFQGLLDVGLIPGETDYRSLTEASMASRTAGNISEGIAQIMQVIPDLYVGFPCNFTHLPIGTKLSGVFSAIARIANTVADILGSTAQLRLTEAGWDRREAEWRHQVEVLDLEIEQAERQILAAERRRDVALRELNNQRRQIEYLAEVQDFLRDKFTSHELYLFLQRETAALHRQMYELAFHEARQAQRAFNFERGLARDFLKGELWNDLHEGLLSGERLQAALRRMEQAYQDDNLREYELTRHISMRQLFPLQLLQLKITGQCEIELPEWLFDLDYPGHYMRRIKNVALTIPCVVGPFVGVHCRLTLLSSMTRVDPRLNGPVASCCGKPAVHPVTRVCSACGQVHPAVARTMDGSVVQNGYPVVPDDPRVIRHRAATEAIATSNGQNDAGLFEVNFRDERYLPFEFLGAVGRYRLELPPENNFFDLASVTDLVVHLRYTAREGGEVLRAAAAEAARSRLPDGGQRLIDVRMELPDVWQRFTGQPLPGPRRMELPIERDLFPFLPGLPALRITRLLIFVSAPAAATNGIRPSADQTIALTVARPAGMQRGACMGPEQRVDCVASAEWPALLQGVAEVDITPAAAPAAAPIVTLKVPAETGVVDDLFVVCVYEMKAPRGSRRAAIAAAST